MSCEQPICCGGCLVSPLFQTPCPKCEDFKIEIPKFNMPPFPPSGLTEEEKAVLGHLKEAWEKFVALGKHLPHDLMEFNYAIHLAQQKLALRVARRVNPEVWSQPEGGNMKVEELQRSLSQTEPVIGSLWRHYGGGIYKVLMKAVESNHPHRVKVIYQSEECGYVWEHPLDEWNKLVELDGVWGQEIRPVEGRGC